MNETTLLTALRIAQAIESDPTTPTSSPGRHVIVRGDHSGVFFGRLASEEGQTVELTDCRHIWYWDGAANTAEIALRGVSKPRNCKIVAPVGRLRVLDAIEVIDCTPEAVESLTGVPEWSKA